MMTQEEIQRIVSLLSSNEIQDIFLGRIGLVGKDDWEPSASYRRLDFVSYEGRSWVAKKDNSNVVPAVGATWQMLSDKGYMTDEDKEAFKQAVIEASKQEINEFTEEKKTELTNYTAQQETSLKNELDAYTEGKKDEISSKVVEGENNFTRIVDESIEFFEGHVEATQSEFDENATAKTNTFNTNATTKTTAFNTNAETKTTAFDTNAESKTNEFNSNVGTKTTEFNENATAKTEEFDTHADKMAVPVGGSKGQALVKVSDEDRDVEWQDVADEGLSQEVEDIYNALPSEKVSGEELEISDAVAIKTKSVGIDGKYKQETTQGYNLVKIKSNINNTTNGITRTANGDIVNYTGTPTGAVDNMWVLGKYNAPETEENAVFKIEEGKTYYLLNCGIYAGTQSIVSCPELTKFNLTDNWIEYTAQNDRYVTAVKASRILTGSSLVKEGIAIDYTFRVGIFSKEEYEPYTGGIPSPNPDYPQPIEQVEEVKWVNHKENLFDQSKIYPNFFVAANSLQTGSSSVTDTSNYIQIKKGFTYYCYTDYDELLNDSKRGIHIYDTSKTYLTYSGYYPTEKYFELTAQNDGYFRFSYDKNCYNISVYENIKKQQLPIDLAGNKLCAVSDAIKDKILIDKKGNVALEKNVELNTFSANNATLYNENDEKIIFKIGSIGKNFDTNNNNNSISNYFICNGSTWSLTSANYGLGISGVGNAFVLLKKDKVQNLDEFKAKIGDNIIEHYSPTNPQYIELPKLTELPKTFEGTNYITAETNLGTTNIEVEYVQDVKKLIENLNARLTLVE